MGTITIDTIKEIREKVREKQTQKRFEHTLGVAYTATCMAFLNDVDPLKAELAGLLHDCAKCYTDKELISMCRRDGVYVSEDELASPAVIHARYGRYMAEKEFGITDIDILNAIDSHTTGRPCMSTLEKIIFTADYIEPLRDKADDLGIARKLAFTDLDECVYEILHSTIGYLGGKGAPIVSGTIRAHEFYGDIHDKRVKGVKGTVPLTPLTPPDTNYRKKGDRMNTELTTAEIVKEIYKALEDKKASDISIIDISELSVVADYFIIASGENTRQTAAIADNVEEALGKLGIDYKQIEGRDSANWILMDYRDIIVHIFDKENRLFYDIERIWKDGRKIVDVSEL
ncbi:MAG: bis(5'-nucleosyl)-tetraphosphatase (symmetrical) YqeK [Eubacteriales bacterium]|nr:bis(5'-nucleosyl)-tetraphosphatase (symmetrical) YqeK [Eubacteriales bacterium]